ncbi:hypothetical protein [Ancylobacter pratisalsi]|uniref:Uncharacterized protein n=1 Tax=Ancylobacter pratisalsi TaxID=1745854 RepID=A0A6P1YTY9_9HYPH|nr:hypothetical protein [Ancylobacter pratisalsi]QIB36495.1 hypothetical protein G3A50_21995 [Ancylobacter pratisalsi]
MMTPRARTVLLCGFLALVMALGSVAATVRTALSHNPVVLLAIEAERHAALAQEIADHGHSHDEGWQDEQAPGHSHGHDPTDHSHDVPSALSALVQMTPPAWRVWSVAVRDAPAVTKTYPFEKPPKHVVTV